MDFIAISFEYDTAPDAAVLGWANALLQRPSGSPRHRLCPPHRQYRQSRELRDPGPGRVYDALKGNPNLFMMLSGHVCSEGRRQDTFDGRTVYSMLSDYQCDPAGGNGWLRS
ncbi:MAG: hypothetical protein IPK00_19555 [Deltaproteobacteria bacterium]|nr:hypothetical protein [Deltaproteobacteria bacterium]